MLEATSDLEGSGEPAVNYNESMIALRYAYLAALVVWLGGMVVLGAVAAPATFAVLASVDPHAGRSLAGDVFGEILDRFRLLEYVSGGVLLLSLGVMAALGPRPPALRARFGIIGTMLAVSLYSGVWVTRQLHQLQEDIGGPVAALAAEDPRRVRFGRLHGASTALMMANAALGLTLVYWEARREPS